MKKKVTKPEKEEFSFCESVSAGGTWHIRKLTEEGKKLEGGADSPALCGRMVAWDIDYPINSEVTGVCAACKNIFKNKSQL